jgi:hypothetical protein
LDSELAGVARDAVIEERVTRRVERATILAI